MLCYSVETGSLVETEIVRVVSPGFNRNNRDKAVYKTRSSGSGYLNTSLYQKTKF